MTNTAQAITLGIDPNTIEAVRPFVIGYAVLQAIVFIVALVFIIRIGMSVLKDF